MAGNIAGSTGVCHPSGATEVRVLVGIRRTLVTLLVFGLVGVNSGCGWFEDNDTPADASVDAGADVPVAKVACETHDDCAGKVAGTGQDTCLKAICGSNGECKKAAQPDGATCDDGQTCTQKDVCAAGVCVGKNTSCPSSDPCLLGTCVDGKGCIEKAIPDGTKCDDGVFCTGDDRCEGGECSPGPVLKCNDGNPCTIDACLMTAGCKNSPSQPGIPCDDGDPCTTKDICLEGECVGGSGGAAASNPCLVVKCDPATGKTEISNKADGTPCKDGAPCTWGDACTAGKCVGTPVDCDAGSACIKGVCDPASGGCLFKPAPNSTSCDDGDACTAFDICLGGNCAGTGNTGAAGCAKDIKCGFGKPIAGCDDCIEEYFEFPYPQQWAGTTEDSGWLKWEYDAAKTSVGKHALKIAWNGSPPGGGSGFLDAAYIHRNLYLEADALVPVLRFKLAMTVGDAACAADTLSLFANGQPVWQRCTSSQKAKLDKKGFETVEVDLGTFRGGPLELMFRARAGTAKTSSGLIHIDDIRLSGSCSPACLAGHVERMDLTVRPTSFLFPALPQPWRTEAGKPDYVAWKRVKGGAHGGKAMLRASWKGTPPGGKQVATLRIPGIEPAKGSELRLALRAPVLGAKGCTGDLLRIRVADKVVHEQCAALADWKVLKVDLAAWVGKTVDVTAEVITAAGNDAAGTVEIDNVAVTGKCDYTCFEATFEPGGLHGWTVAKKSPQMTMTWSLASDDAISKPNAAFASHDDKEKGDSTAGLMATPGTSAVRMPVLGAMYTFQARVEVGKAKCPFDDVFEMALFGWPFKELVNWDDAKSLKGFCEDSEDWAHVVGDVPPPLYGRWVQPAFLIHKGLLNPSLKVWVDDVRLRCK